MNDQVLALISIDLPDPKTIVLLVGLFLLVIGVIGGGFEIKEIKVPPLEKWTRLIAVALGLSLLAFSFAPPNIFEAIFPRGSSAQEQQAQDKPKDLANPSVAAVYGKRGSLPISGSTDQPFFMTRDVTPADTAGKTKMELDEWRNEIYARNGRKFNDPVIQAYFDQQPWYHPVYQPDAFPPSVLSPVQQRNIAALHQQEYK
jgi:YARHG domain